MKYWKNDNIKNKFDSFYYLTEINHRNLQKPKCGANYEN
jgi:hypothetical protein